MFIHLMVCLSDLRVDLRFLRVDLIRVSFLAALNQTSSDSSRHRSEMLEKLGKGSSYISDFVEKLQVAKSAKALAAGLFFCSGRKHCTCVAQST